MTRFASAVAAIILSCTVPRGDAFQTSQMLPMRVDPIPKMEIQQRLGLKESDPLNNASTLSIGSGPNMGYALTNEHEVVCPVSGAHQGILCTASLSNSIEGENAESIANNNELISQAILSGSLAASIRNRCKDGSSVYYLPYVITLVESLVAEEVGGLDFGEMVFNSGGLETNEILMDCSGDEKESVMLYACNTQQDAHSATSDVYLLPSSPTGSCLRFTVDYKVATINLQQIRSFGDRDSVTPLRPDVWLKDDYSY